MGISDCRLSVGFGTRGGNLYQPHNDHGIFSCPWFIWLNMCIAIEVTSLSYQPFAYGMKWAVKFVASLTRNESVLAKFQMQQPSVNLTCQEILWNVWCNVTTRFTLENGSLGPLQVHSAHRPSRAFRYEVLQGSNPKCLVSSAIDHLWM